MSQQRLDLKKEKVKNLRTSGQSAGPSKWLSIILSNQDSLLGLHYCAPVMAPNNFQKEEKKRQNISESIQGVS